jgi:hypothetical protein
MKYVCLVVFMGSYFLTLGQDSIQHRVIFIGDAGAITTPK